MEKRSRGRPRKLSEQQVREILDRVHNTAKEIAEAYGVSAATVAAIRSKKSKSQERRISTQLDLPWHEDPSTGITVGG